MPGTQADARAWAARSRSLVRRLAVPVWCAALATIVIGPMMGRGWVVLLDWATGPRIRLADRIAAGDSLPAGPVFFGSAALLHRLFGAGVGWLMPWVTLFVAGVGAARLVSRSVHTVAARLAAATAYAWNPFVHERLYAGQLAVLTGYAVLPFVAAAALAALARLGSSGPGDPPDHRESPPALRAAHRRWGSRRALPVYVALTWAVATASSIHFAVLGGVVVAAAVAAHVLFDHRRLPAYAGWLVSAVVMTGVVTALWLAPRISDAPPTGNDRTIAAFATRGDPQIGLAAGVALQRGFWRPSPGEPGSDLGWWWPAVGGALGGAAVVGLVGLWRRGARRLVLTVVLAGTSGWLLGQGGAGLVGPVFRFFTDVPGMRIMREAGKFISLVSLAWAVGLGGFAELVAARVNLSAKRPSRIGLGAALGALPLLLTPGLAWGVGGRLEAVRYPASWTAVAAELDRHPDGKVIVLPFTGYFDPGFTRGRVVKHPGRAFFGSRVVQSDDAKVEGLEPSATTTAISAALEGPDAGRALAGYGIGWIVGVADPAPFPIAEFERVFVSRGWALFRNTTFSGERTPKF